MPPEPTPPDKPPFDVYPVPPELLAYARQTLDIEAEMAALRELDETGGIPFEDVIARAEAVVRGS